MRTEIYFHFFSFLGRAGRPILGISLTVFSPF
jgi:hypothetical protein